MKGHMQDGKFHPHSNKKGVRKSRDPNAKSQGVKVRNKRAEWIKEDVFAFKNDDIDGEASGFSGYIKQLHLEVFPVDGDPNKGWEYRIRGDVGKKETEEVDYESIHESWTGDPNDHAPTAKVARKWAEETARSFIEEAI